MIQVLGKVHSKVSSIYKHPVKGDIDQYKVNISDGDGEYYTQVQVPLDVFNGVVEGEEVVIDVIVFANLLRNGSGAFSTFVKKRVG